VWPRVFENHSHPLAQFDHINFGTVYVLRGNFDGSFDPNPIDQVIHPVQTPEQSGFTATGRPDERGNQLLPDIE